MNKRIFNAVTDIDDRLILEADPENEAQQKPKIKAVKICTIAASICVLLGLGAFIGIRLVNTEKPINTSDKLFSIRYGNVTSDYEDDYKENVARVPKWDERTIENQYSDLGIDGVMYSGTSRKLDVLDIGKKLGEYTASGYDTYEDKTYEMTVRCYEIKGVSIECAVAVELKDGEYFSYTNSYYKPKTLGDFVSDLNLTDNTTIGYAYYNWYDEENGKYQDVTFEQDINDSDIWDILLTDETRDVPAVEDFDSMFFLEEISFSISSEKLGFENISIGMTKDGYLVTNILSTGKAFFLGEEKCEELVDYVVENYEGVIIVYNYPESDDDTDKKANGSDSGAVVSTAVTAARPE